MMGCCSENLKAPQNQGKNRTSIAQNVFCYHNEVLREAVVDPLLLLGPLNQDNIRWKPEMGQEYSNQIDHTAPKTKPREWRTELGFHDHIPSFWSRIWMDLFGWSPFRYGNHRQKGKQAVEYLKQLHVKHFRVCNQWLQTYTTKHNLRLIFLSPCSKVCPAPHAGYHPATLQESFLEGKEHHLSSVKNNQQLQEILAFCQ